MIKNHNLRMKQELMSDMYLRDYKKKYESKYSKLTQQRSKSLGMRQLESKALSRINKLALIKSGLAGDIEENQKAIQEKNSIPSYIY